MNQNSKQELNTINPRLSTVLFYGGIFHTVVECRTSVLADEEKSALVYMGA